MFVYFSRLPASAPISLKMSIKCRRTASAIGSDLLESWRRMVLSRFTRLYSRRLLATVLMGVGMGLVGCTAAPAQPTGGAKTNPGADSLLKLSRTGSPSFHVANLWTDLTFHGTLVMAAGYDYTRAIAGGLPCNACHAGDSPTQVGPNLHAPNCFACHDGGPDGSAFHPFGWLDFTDRNFHGNVVVSAGYDFNRARSGILPCSACHAGVNPEDASPNSRAPSCFACHDGGPDGSADHPLGWLDRRSPTFHGRAAAIGGFTSPGQLSCASCHAAWPGHESINTRAPSCFACHKGGPDGSPGHPMGFSNPASGSFHGIVVKKAGDYAKAKSGTLTCDACHAGEDPTQKSPMVSAPSCFSCHRGGPDRSAHPTGWDDLTPPHNHGAVVKAAGGDFTKAKVGDRACNACHAGSSPGEASPVASAPNCYSCHSGGPDGSPGHDSPLWAWYRTSPDFHGAVVKAAGGDYTKAKSGGLACSVCHAGISAHQLSPVPDAPSCFACHQSGPSGQFQPISLTTPGNLAFLDALLVAHGGIRELGLDGFVVGLRAFPGPSNSHP